MSTPSTPESNPVIPTGRLTPQRVAEIAYIENGGKANFVFAVYEHGTMVVCPDMSVINNPTDDEVKTTASKILDEFPGFIPGTEYGDFNVCHGKQEWFNEHTPFIRIIIYNQLILIHVDYENMNPDVSCGLKGRDTVMKDIEEKNCVFVGIHKPELPV